MKYSKECECCGHKLTAYTHSLNKPLVNGLRQLVDWYEREKKICNINNDLVLTHNQIANFQKLKHFGLVDLIQRGGFVPTEIGIQFIYGEAQAYSTSASMGNVTLSIDHEAWKTHGKMPHLVYVSEVDQTMYKKRPAYQAEKSNQSKMF